MEFPPIFISGGEAAGRLWRGKPATVLLWGRSVVSSQGIFPDSARHIGALRTVASGIGRRFISLISRFCFPHPHQGPNKKSGRRDGVRFLFCLSLLFLLTSLPSRDWAGK